MSDHEQTQVSDLVLPQCGTCAHWVLKNEFPYCHELQYWIPVVKEVHTPSDFGCVKHSALTGDSVNVNFDELDVRVANCLKADGIKHIDELRDVARGRLKVPNLGRRGLDELLVWLGSHAQSDNN